MKTLKRRLEGAISVFLVIIMVSNYALIGVLVDSARHRMARANAEMALDTAAASVLSYYNKMVFDLYGLFATDSLTLDQIETKLTEYTEKTLGITQMKQSEVTELTKAIVDAIPYFQKDNIDGILFDGYHYKIKIEADNSLSYSLANTDAVEAQIIDHMKYKAPAAMLEGMNDFLTNLNSILNVKDRIEKTKDKIETTQADKEHLCQAANDLLEEIKTHNDKIAYFSSTGNIGTDKATGGAYNPWRVIDDFDDKLDEIAALYSYDIDGEVDIAALQSAYDDEVQNLSEIFTTLSVNAETLNDEANAIREKMTSLNGEFEAYIERLNKKIEADPDNENLKTLYLPEIEIAKATMGEVLKNIDLVLMGRRCTTNLRSYLIDYKPSLLTSAKVTIDHRIGNVSGTAYLKSTIYAKDPAHAQNSFTLMEDIRSDFEELYNYARSFREIEEPTLKTSDVSSKNVDTNVKKEEDKNKEKLRPLTETDMVIKFEKTAVPTEWEGTIDKLDNDNSVALLQAGLNLLNAIESFLENARDSLYVNEYIISYFPNYVQHYNAPDSPLAQNHSNKRLIDDKDYYKSFNASQAELEYILIGDASAAKNVAGVSAKLTAIRMVFNTAAIMTDSGKVQQANMLAAAAGPFAPVVALALLLAWALGESVLDTLDLLNGEEVLVFKQSTDWSISLEGGVKRAVKGATDIAKEVMKDTIKDRADALGESAKSTGNTIVYDAYQRINDPNSAVSSAKSELGKWSSSINSTLSGVAGDLQINSADANGLIDKALGSTMLNKNTGGDPIEMAKDRALIAIDNGVDEVVSKIETKSSELIDKAGDHITEAVSSRLEDTFKVGNPEEGGTGDHGMFSVKFTYLDYMRIFLMFSDKKTRVQRIQKLIQANVRYGSKYKNFNMSESYVSVGATLTGEINFLFMSNAILPDQLKQNGKLKFTVSTSMSY